jgi:murein DD-endopeptidase MepM/ murein hydrolase activator NlpD
MSYIDTNADADPSQDDGNKLWFIAPQSAPPVDASLAGAPGWSSDWTPRPAAAAQPQAGVTAAQPLPHAPEVSIWPVPGLHDLNVGSGHQGDGRFGSIRDGGRRRHKGVDITADVGSPVAAAGTAC